MESTKHSEIMDLIIIGGGPGGLTAGMYAARSHLNTLLMEGSSTLSQITYTDQVENYPGFPEGIAGFELIDRFRKQGLRFGLKTASQDVTGLSAGEEGGRKIWEVQAGGGIVRAIACIVATGTSWRRLGIPGEEKLVGRGISYCGTCDGPLFRDKEIVVIGGGDTAVSEAVYLTRFAAKVTVIHRRDRLRASAVLQKRAFENPRIDFVWNSVPEEILGTESVTGITIRDRHSGQKSQIASQGVFIFVGLNPNTGFLSGSLEVDAEGYIRVDAAMRTSAEGIFACGDCTCKALRQVVTACGDGATAAHSAREYIEEWKGRAYGS
jgi:thioredoxin reductase (NADPH)